MIAAIQHCLKRIFSPHGRDGRQVFWRYFLFVVLLNIIVLGLFATPPLLNIVSEIPANAGNLDANLLEALILENMAANGLAQTLVEVGLGLGVLNVILLANAVVRRAHDAGLPGAIVAVPLCLQLVWMYFAFSQRTAIKGTLQDAAAVREVGDLASVQAPMIAQDLLGWIVVLIVAWLGFARSQNGPNQYGDGPFRP